MASLKILGSLLRASDAGMYSFDVGLHLANEINIGTLQPNTQSGTSCGFVCFVSLIL